ncbi:16207_t:CDS:2, partial [Acaulospora colombiana]
IYPDQDLLKAKYELLAKTNMVDFISELYKQIHNTDKVPSEFATKRQEVLQTLENLQAEAQKVLDIIENPEVITALRQDKLQNLHFLREKYG